MKSLDAKATREWAIATIRSEIVAETTDAEIELLVGEYEMFANDEGVSLHSSLADIMREVRSEAQDGLAAFVITANGVHGEDYVLPSYTVRLADDTVGTLNTKALDYQHPNAFMGEVVRVKLFDENGNQIERDGVLVEVLRG